MHNIFTCLAVILGSMVFCSMKSVELDAPLPTEQNGKWKHVPGEISLYLGEDEPNKALRFVAEEQEFCPRILLSLDEPESVEEVKAFLQECRIYIDQRSHRRIAMVAIGKSLMEQVQCWIAENVAKSPCSAPNLGNILFGEPAFQVLTESGTGQPSLKVSYAFILPPMRTSRDLRKLWNLALVQYMTSQRLNAQRIPCETDQVFSSFLLPQKKVAYRIVSQEMQGGFSRFLHGMQEIKQVGFTAQELAEAREFFLEKIKELQLQAPHGAAMEIASFHAEGFLRNLGLVSYAYFLDSAPALIDSITPVDVAIALQECFGDEKRHILLAANTLQSEKLELAIRNEIDKSHQLTIERSPAPIATDMERPTSRGTELFYQLPIEVKHEKLIYEIIDTMAKDNIIKLGLKRKSMESKGKKIHCVHPMRFLGHVFANPHLRSCMREISRSYFKWDGFMDGFSKRIEGESARGNLLPYVPGFAEHLQVDEQKVIRYLERHDWEGLVKFLL